MTFVLLIACANVANLLLARAGARRQEIGMRVALGAGRWRLVRQLITESLVLGLLGGAFGLLVTFWGIRLFGLLAPGWLPNVHAMGVSAPVVAFLCATALLTGLLAGLAPAIQFTRPHLSEALKDCRRGSAGKALSRTRGRLVAGEVALGLVLLIGAGLMLNSLLRLLRVKPGYEPAGVLTMQIDLAGPNYMHVVEMRDIAIRSISPAVEAFYSQVLERVRGFAGSGVGCAGRLVALGRVVGGAASQDLHDRRAP